MNHKEKRESPLKGILRFASQRKRELHIAVILSVLSSAFGVVPYAAVGVLLGNALDGSLTVNLAVILTLAALLGYFLKFYLYAKSTMCSHKAAYEIIRNIRCAIMRKMSRMSMGAIQEKSSGEYKQLVIDDTERLEGQIAHAIPEMTASILIPIFVFIFLMLVDWRMALASLISAILGNIIYYGMMIGRSDMMKEYMAANTDMNGTIVEYVSGMEVIRIFNQTASSIGRFQSAVLRVRDITTTWYWHCYPFMSVGQAVMPSTTAFVLPIGVKLLSGGAVTLNGVILCILLSMSLVGSLQAMIEFWQDLAAIYEIQPRIQSILDAPELSEPNEPKYCKGADVELKDVHFSYKDREVIHGISFAAKAGTVTALVGPSGSGKSTLAKLIARFWDVDSGSVIVGGVDVRQLSLTDLSEQISYVSQDNFLFHMSLRENIRIGKPDASNEEVERAAAQAGCNEFIARFPQGYDTKAGDSGTRLSGGERQRIAIARAILKNAPIIILDEATAFADPENEDKLQRSIDRLTKGKTLIVIAHRLSTIMYADQILVLEDGAITAGGTHEQLLSSSQTYLDMWSAHISAMDWSIKQEVNTSC
ncbi:MAG: ABC transporter ATP-binding protein [Lachnospiraceae bacterium]